MGFPRLWRERSFLGTFAKADSLTLFSDLNATIVEGQKVAITGPNGAGKTTLLKLLAGMLNPLAGSLLWKGTPTPQMPREFFGLCFGTKLLYSDLTGYQNLTYTAALLGRGTVDIELHAANWGINKNWLDAVVETYSMGQRALLGLARATLGEPQLLLLDEPTAFLDLTHETLVGDRLRSLSTTVVYTTQHPPRNLPADQVIRL